MTQAALRSRLGGADHEEKLARAAAAGSGRAFATLYHRYEERVFGLAFRLTASGDLAAQATRDAFADALDAMSHVESGDAPFGSSLLIAARNRSIELIGREGEPEDEVEPEDDDAFGQEQQSIREAAFRLDEREREILALGRVEGLAPGAIAAIMDVGGDSIADLTARARLALHDELWGTEAAVAAPSSGECAGALELMALRDDGHLEDEEERGWLVEHLAHCRDCRLRLDEMEQAQAAYERWAPVAAPAGLLGGAMAATGRFTDTDGRQANAQRAARRPAAAGLAGLAGLAQAATRKRERPSLAPAFTTAGNAASSTLASTRAAATRVGSSVWERRPWSDRLVTAGLILVMLLGLSGTLAGATLVLRGDDRSEPSTSPSSEEDALTGQRPAPVQTPERQSPVEQADRPRKARPTTRKQEEVVVIPPRVEPDRSESRQRQTRQRRTRVPSAEEVPLPKTTPTTPQPAPTQPPANTTPQPPQPQPAPLPQPAQ